jgi:hypothetical protein
MPLFESEAAPCRLPNRGSNDLIKQATKSKGRPVSGCCCGEARCSNQNALNVGLSIKMCSFYDGYDRHLTIICARALAMHASFTFTDMCSNFKHRSIVAYTFFLTIDCSRRQALQQTDQQTTLQHDFCLLFDCCSFAFRLIVTSCA